MMSCYLVIMFSIWSVSTSIFFNADLHRLNVMESTSPKQLCKKKNLCTVAYTIHYKKKVFFM